MAVFVEGMTCRLCGERMESSQHLTAFRPFVANHLDPLWLFSDGVFHDSCFNRHPLAEKALARSNELDRQTRVWPPSCVACERSITNPEDHFAFGHLTEREHNPLYAYNYLHLHRSCMRHWPELSRVHLLLEELQRSGTWDGPALTHMLDEIRKAEREGGI